MKRRLLKRVCVLLLMGAVLNIAMAWASVFFVRTAQQTSLSGWRDSVKTQTGYGWEVYRYETWSAVRLIANVRQNPLFDESPKDEGLYPFASAWPSQLDAILLDGAASASGKRSFGGAQMLELRGWPMLSMQATWNGNEQVEHIKRWRWGLPLSANVVRASGGVVLNDLNVLPLRPQWPGFAINTLFYAAIIWLIFLAPFQLRRLIRRKHNRCAACGYPVGVGSICTECGAAVPPHISADIRTAH